MLYERNSIDTPNNDRPIDEKDSPKDMLSVEELVGASSVLAFVSIFMLLRVSDASGWVAFATQVNIRTEVINMFTESHYVNCEPRKPCAIRINWKDSQPHAFIILQNSYL